MRSRAEDSTKAGKATIFQAKVTVQRHNGLKKPEKQEKACQVRGSTFTFGTEAQLYRVKGIIKTEYRNSSHLRKGLYPDRHLDLCISERHREKEFKRKIKADHYYSNRVKRRLCLS